MMKESFIEISSLIIFLLVELNRLKTAFLLLISVSQNVIKMQMESIFHTEMVKTLLVQHVMLVSILIKELVSIMQ